MRQLNTYTYEIISRYFDYTSYNNVTFTERSIRDMTHRDNKPTNRSRRDALRAGAIGSVSFLGLSTIGWTTAQEGPTTITECREIDEPGEYVLGDDLSAEGDCLEITTSDVTLDGNGHTIEGDGTGTGLDIEWSGSTVRNLTVRNFGLGIRVNLTSNVTLASTTVRQNGSGVVVISASSDVLMRDCDIRQNDGRGVSVSDYSRDVLMRDCDIRQNGSRPVRAGSSAIFGLEDCRVIDNGGPVTFVPRPESTIEGTLVSGSEGAGLETNYGDRGIYDEPMLIRDCVIEDCDGAGIEQPNGSLDVRECTLSGNRIGYWVPGGLDPYETILRYSNIEDNEEYGVLHTRADEVTTTVEATCNWWGHESGPVHENELTASQQGQRVSDDVAFLPWSVERIEDGEGRCEGGLGEEPEAPPKAGTGYIAKKSYRRIMGLGPYDDVDCWDETLYATAPSEVENAGFAGPGEITLPSEDEDDEVAGGRSLPGHVIRAEPDAVPVTLPTWGGDRGRCESLLFVDPEQELRADVEYRIVTVDPGSGYEEVDTGGFAGTIDEIVRVDFEPTDPNEGDET